jgi:hypothetical protein
MFDLPSFPVAATSGMRVPWNEVADLRSRPGSFQGQDLAGLVRHSDEQTVVALAAMKNSIEAAGWSERNFANWGVVASPRSFGRVKFDTAITRFRKVHAAGVHPLSVAHLSLHAMASTLSIAFGMHGPSLGVSGQTGHLGEVLLTGIGLIEREDIDGLWTVITEPDPESSLDEEGHFVRDATVQAAVLGMCREHGSMELTLSPGKFVESSVSQLIDWLASSTSASWRVGVAGVGVVEVCRREALKQAS